MDSKERAFPIIIGGCHRSGTSVVRRVLNAHSRIYCGPEVKFFRDLYSDYLIDDPVEHTRFLTSARSILPESDLLEIMGAAFVELHSRAAANAGKKRWSDKSPENVLYLRQWEILLGTDWVFIHTVRNPLDTIVSIDEVNFRYAIPAGLEERIRHYNAYAQAGLEYERAYPARCYRLIYEKLVRSPGDEIGALMDWLGEQVEPRQLLFNTAPHQPGLEDPKIKYTDGIHASSVDRWKRLLDPEQAERIIRETQDVWSLLDPDAVHPLAPPDD